MNTKNKIVVLLLAGFVLVSFGQKAEAAFYTTVRSTAVQVAYASSYTSGVELLAVRWSSGSTVGTDQFIIVVDSIAVENAASSPGQILLGGTTLQSVAYSRARYPNQSNIIPPIVVFSTLTATTNGVTVEKGQQENKVDLRDSNGCGTVVGEGIVVLQPGVAYGTIVTIEWRPRPQSGHCRE